MTDGFSQAFACGIVAAGLALVVGCGSSLPSVVENPQLVVLDSVDTAPVIEGGFTRVRQLTEYPEAARRDEARGTIWVRFVVTVSGRPTRAVIADGGHYALEAEALDVVDQLRFTPGKIAGGPVPTTVEMPVTLPAPPPPETD